MKPTIGDKKKTKEAERAISDLHLSHPQKRVPCKDWSVKPLQMLLTKGLNV